MYFMMAEMAETCRTEKLKDKNKLKLKLIL
jgi:hypothetical protein